MKFRSRQVKANANATSASRLANATYCSSASRLANATYCSSASRLAIAVASRASSLTNASGTKLNNIVQSQPQRQSQW